MPRQRSLLERLTPYRFEVFLLLIALLPAFYIAFGNPNTILDWYSSDDGFLYFQVARNLASGHGFTFDGINPTNGFHPLWLFLITPIFALAQIDLLLPLRLLVILSGLLSAGSAILVYRILKPLTSEWVAVFIGLLWIVLPRIHDLTTHAGVEAGLSAFTLLLFWHQIIKVQPSAKPDLQKLVILGSLGALAIFSRLDIVFIVALGGFWLWLKLWNSPKKEKQIPWIRRLQTGIALFGPVTLLMLIYISWNYFAFGIAMPVSGEVKLWWGTLKNTVYGFPVNSFQDFFGQFITDDPELGPWSLLTSPLYVGAEWLLTVTGTVISVGARRLVLLTIGSVLTALAAVLIWVRREFLSRAVRQLALISFFLGCLIQLSYYKLAGSVAQQPWYWISEMIFLLIVLGLLLETLLRTIASKQLEGLSNLAWSLVFFGGSISYLFFIQTAVREPGDGSNHFYIDRARWLEANTEPGARVAITGAGNLAYFVQDRTIVNMDGLMNMYDYLLAMQAGNGADYLAGLGVDYIFGNEYILTETNPYAPMLDGHLESYRVYLFADRELPLWRFTP